MLPIEHVLNTFVSLVYKFPHYSPTLTLMLMLTLMLTLTLEQRKHCLRMRLLGSDISNWVSALLFFFPLSMLVTAPLLTGSVD